MCTAYRALGRARVRNRRLMITISISFWCFNRLCHAQNIWNTSSMVCFCEQPRHIIHIYTHTHTHRYIHIHTHTNTHTHTHTHLCPILVSPLLEHPHPQKWRQRLQYFMKLSVYMYVYVTKETCYMTKETKRDLLIWQKSPAMRQKRPALFDDAECPWSRQWTSRYRHLTWSSRSSRLYVYSKWAAPLLWLRSQLSPQLASYIYIYIYIHM